MKYRQLLDKLKSLSDEQLNCDLAVELDLSEECFSATTGDFTFDIAGENNDYLDDGHPVFRVNY